MVRKTAFIVVRILGTLAGLSGVALLRFSQFMWSVEGRENAEFGKVMATFGVMVAGYLLYVAWLVWWRFSPLAVRHVCGVLAVYAWSQIPHSQSRSPAMGLVLFGSLIGMYVVYRAVSYFVNCLLFPIPREA